MTLDFYSAQVGFTASTSGCGYYDCTDRLQDPLPGSGGSRWWNVLLKFLHGVFSRLHVLTRHLRILVLTGSTSLLFVAIHIALSYTCCSLLSISPTLLLSFFRLHLLHEGKCQNVGRLGLTPGMASKTRSGELSLDELARETLCISRIFHTSLCICIEFISSSQ